MFKKNILQIGFAALTILTFVFLKISNLDFRFSDGNIYLYMAKAVTRGFWPYRDFVLVDPPFLIFLLAGLRFIFGNNLLVYNALPFVFEAASAVLIFLLLSRWKNPFAFCAPLVYLFSFTVLSTSDYLTGVQLSVFLTLLALFLYEKERPFLSGLSWSLACLTKFYLAPALIGFLIYIIWKKEWQRSWRVVCGGVVGTVIVLGPFIFLAPTKVYDYLILMHFNRPAGLDKLNVLSFFVAHEWFLLASAALGIYLFRRDKLLFLLAPLVLFFLFFKDIYYLYLDSVLPFLVIFSLMFLAWLYEKPKKFRPAFIIILILCFSSIFGFYINYKQNFSSADRFANVKEVADYVRSLEPAYDIYGSQDASLVALLSGKNLFGNYINTDTQVFAAKALNLEEVSKEAAEKGVYLVFKRTEIPGFIDTGLYGYFSKEIFEKYCLELRDFALEVEYNEIAIYKCEKNKK